MSFRKIIVLTKKLMRVEIRSRSTLTEASRKKQNDLLSILNDRASSNEALSNAVNSPISSYLSERNLEQEKRLIKMQNELIL
jgi:hypothetical protein